MTMLVMSRPPSAVAPSLRCGARALQYRVGHARRESVRRFLSGEVAHQPLRSSVTERAVEGATDLLDTHKVPRPLPGCRRTRCRARLRRCVDRVDAEPLARAIDRTCSAAVAGRARVESADRARRAFLRHARHLGECLGAAQIDPVPELLDHAIPRCATGTPRSPNMSASCWRVMPTVTGGQGAT